MFFVLFIFHEISRSKKGLRICGLVKRSIFNFAPFTTLTMITITDNTWCKPVVWHNVGGVGGENNFLQDSVYIQNFIRATQL